MLGVSWRLPEAGCGTDAVIKVPSGRRSAVFDLIGPVTSGPWSDSGTLTGDAAETRM